MFNFYKADLILLITVKACSVPITFDNVEKTLYFFSSASDSD